MMTNNQTRKAPTAHMISAGIGLYAINSLERQVILMIESGETLIDALKWATHGLRGSKKTSVEWYVRTTYAFAGR